MLNKYLHHWLGDNEGTVWSSSQAATWLPVYHTPWRLHTVLFNAERQAGKLQIPISKVVGLTKPGIELRVYCFIADSLSTRPFLRSTTFDVIVIIPSKAKCKKATSKLRKLVLG